MLMTTKVTCRTMQRTGATLAVQMESSVTWWIAWNKTLCVHSWQLTALSAMRTYAKTFRSAFTQNVPLSSDANKHVNTVCMWKKVVHSFRPKSELDIKTRREHVEHAKRNSTCRTWGRKGHWAGDQICPNFVGNRSARGSSTRPWNANWSRDVSKTDKKHMKGKDQRKGAGKRTSFRTRARYIREARTAQAMNDEAGMCTGKCFKFVPFVPSSVPVPGHAARGVIDPVPWRLQDLYDPVPGRQAVQNSNDPVPGRRKAQFSDDPVPGRRTAHHVFNPVPGRQTMKDDLVP